MENRAIDLIKKYKFSYLEWKENKFTKALIELLTSRCKFSENKVLELACCNNFKKQEQHFDFFRYLLKFDKGIKEIIDIKSLEDLYSNLELFEQLELLEKQNLL